MGTITLALDDAIIAQLTAVADACSEADAQRDGATSHGPITATQLLELLAEDIAMINTRPGSWEAQGMHQVLTAHGYEI